jgi:hypothetical protein
MPRSKKGFTGLSFHVQENGDACNFHFPSDASGKNVAFQTMYIYGKSGPWQLYPESQGYALFRQDAWSHIRLEVGARHANLLVNGTPVLTMFDMPFHQGGIRFWSYYGQVFIRNLSVTDLSHSRVVPVFKNPWHIYGSTNIVRRWQVALCDDTDAPTSSSVPSNEMLGRLDWQQEHADKRGVVNLTRAFRNSNTRASACARAEVVSDKAIQTRLYLTYTDDLTLWCNGKLVFTGEPRGWSDPNREEHFGGRLVPDEYSAPLRLRKGPNSLLVRTRVADPWGWGFWMRFAEIGPNQGIQPTA